MTLIYIHHDCFVLVTSRAAVVFDYWRAPLSEGREGLPRFFDLIGPQLPVYVLVSHHHKDHYTRDIFGWDALRPGLHYVLSRDTAKAARPYITPGSHWSGHKVDPSRVTVMQPGDEVQLPGLDVHAYGSTDIGNSWVVTTCGRAVMHAGDLNAWIWKDESTPDEVRQALSAYNSILMTIGQRWPRLDVAMFPVDSRIGSEWWTGAKMLVDTIDVGHFVPMHFELADSEAELTQRHLDAADFRPYANPRRGEYIALQSPYAAMRLPEVSDN